MAKKLYQLPEEVIEIIHEVMEERHLKFEVDAVIYMITEYKKKDDLPQQIVNAFNEINKPWMERLRWATQTAEQNSQITLDVLNTQLYESQIERCIGVDKVKHPVISESEESLKNRIAHFKQKKDDRKNKKK